MRGYRFRSSQKVTRAKTASPLRRSCLRPSAKLLSACGRRHVTPHRTREKTSGTQGSVYRVIDARGKFGEHERCVRVARGAAESNSSFLSP